MHKNGVNITDSRRVLLIGKTVKYESAFSHDNITAIEKELREIQPDYRLMAEENRNYLSKKLELSRFRFGSEQEYAYSTEELLREQHLSGRVNPVLLDKFYDLGRFYLITDTGNLPPAWGQHNINTNLQVCAGNMAGLDREMDIYFRFYENKFEDFRTNARRLFGARGMLAPIHCDYDSGLSYHFSRTSPQFAWTGCLGWIYNELWGYYLVTGDLEFLRERVVPGLKEIALFLKIMPVIEMRMEKQFLSEFSPENAALDPNTGEGAYPTAINAVMDIMICREILDNLLAACRELGIEQENIPHWEKQKSCLPPFLLDEEGGLKEWAWADIRENYKHRHVSHHYDAWPGHRANWEETPELASAILISNRKRAQQDDSAHGIIHRLFTAIRLKDKKDAQGYLRQLMEHGFITRSMNTRHYPYAVCWPDLLGAMPAVLMEMAVYSEPGIIEILPAMPETLRSGNVNGIRLYTFARLEELVWDLDKMTAGGRITAIRRQELCLRFRHGRTVFRINGKMADCDENQVYFEAAEGETVDFSMEWV